MKRQKRAKHRKKQMKNTKIPKLVFIKIKAQLLWTIEGNQKSVRLIYITLMIQIEKILRTKKITTNRYIKTIGQPPNGAQNLKMSASMNVCLESRDR